jgi:acetylornithine/succinyldiaminopimelate/putrescine aminotransferase
MPVTAAAFTEYVNPVFGRFLSMTGRDLHLVEARGTSLIDASGRELDDWIAGFGTFNLGHNHPAVVAALREALDANAPNLFAENVNPFAGELAEELARATGFEIAHFTNSGSEAVEAAIKAAKLITARSRIVHAERAYHGVTFENHERVAVPFGDLDALARVVGDAAAFIIEPVQMEGGARIASRDYLDRASELCEQHGALFIVDEVQSGMGRCGTLTFARGAEDHRVLLLAKALGGGVMPIGAALMSRETWSRAWGTYLRCESQNTTFGGNTLACRAALATLRIVNDEQFFATVRDRGEELHAALHARIGDSPLVRRISILGLMGGIELRDLDHPWLRWSALGLPELEGSPVSGPLIVDRLQRAGILAQVCANDWSVVRIEPPLIVSRETCARFVRAVGDAIEWLEAKA